MRRRRAWLAGGLAVAVVAGVAVAVIVAAGGGGARPAARGGPTPGSTATTPLSATSSATSSAASSATSSATSAAAAPGPRPALPAPGSEAFGVNVNRLFNDRTYSAAQIDAELGRVAATAVTVGRSDALWEATEPAAPVAGVHRYDWAFDDQIAAALAAHGLTWLPIVDYSAPWAQSVPGVDHSPPSSDADYAAYAAAVAARYGPGGTFWSSHPALRAEPVSAVEIWNEPDNPQFWVPSVDAARYAGLYLAARTAIDAVAPGVRVLVGGLTHPQTFVPALVGAQPDLVGHVDGVAIHPYGAPAVVLARVRTARAALRAAGLGGVPLYVTEFGWATHPAGAADVVAAAQRPGDIRTTVAALGHLACGLAAAILYTWITPERDPHDRGDWFGISSSPADVAALTAGVRAAQAPGPALPCGG